MSGKVLIRKVVQLGPSRYIALPKDFPPVTHVKVEKVDHSVVVRPVLIREVA